MAVILLSAQCAACRGVLRWDYPLDSSAAAVGPPVGSPFK